MPNKSEHQGLVASLATGMKDIPRNASWLLGKAMSPGSENGAANGGMVDTVRQAGSSLVAALPGSLYVYQGDELGLPEVEDLTPAQRRDPIFVQTGGTDPGRDGCRVPLPWSGDAPLRSPAPKPTASTSLPAPAATA